METALLGARALPSPACHPLALRSQLPSLTLCPVGVKKIPAAGRPALPLGPLILGCVASVSQSPEAPEWWSACPLCSPGATRPAIADTAVSFLSCTVF